MNRLSIWVFTLPLIFQMCSTPSSDQLDVLFRDYSGNKPGAALLIIKDGKILEERCYGLAHLESRTPVNPNTNFRLASTTKQFTATSILQLMEQGKLDFNTSLRQVFPEFPVYADQITFEQILHHTSGLLDYESLIPDSATIPVRDADVLALLLTQDSTYFPPGTSYSYSNTGYSILALAVERLSGLPFYTYLEQKVFEPLGMNATVAFVKGINTIPNRAFGYHVENDSIFPSDQSMTSSVLGDGGIYSSLRDLYKWDQALNADTLLSQTYSDSMYTPWLEDYACGWRIEDYKGRKRISHTGSTCGFRSDYVRIPEAHFSVIILANRREPGVQALAEAVTDLYLPPIP